LTVRFNSLLRRFRQYKTENEWAHLLLEGARPFAGQLALFVVENGALRLIGRVNLSLADGLTLPLEGAAAFQTVCATKDPVTALRDPAEVTLTLYAGAATERVHLLPIVNETRVAAILFAAEVEDSALDGLEFITGLAAGVLERLSNAGRHAQITILPHSPGPLAFNEQKHLSHASGSPDLSLLSGNEQQLHIRARRFSRTTVAELQLAKPDACRVGREQSSLYVLLAKEIDRSREIFRKQFMTIPSMADYLHLELVQTTAEGDVSKLGADYPGPLL
jgi:hypothetical protein